MKVNCFGIAKEITSTSLLIIESDDSIKTVGALRAFLLEQYAEFNNFKRFMIAVNHSYAVDEQALAAEDEIAIIPPVSGG